jgi:hypothetical protein
LETGGSQAPGAPRPVKLCEPTRDGDPYLRASFGAFNGHAALAPGAESMADLRGVPIGQIGRISLILLLAFGVLLAINHVSLLLSPCVQPQVEGQNDHAEKDTDEKHICKEFDGVVAAGFAKIANSTPEAWTAGATVILALVTCFVASVTKRQVDLSWNEFLSTHRPRLRVRSARLTYIEADQFPHGRLTIVNIGDSAARITELSADIACRVGKAFGEGRPNLGNRQVIDRNVLDRGEHAEFTIISSDRISAQDYQRHKFGQESATCIVGKITYVDQTGVIRATGFFRSYDRTREYYVRDEEPDYEYED